jgi:hypothetical protein
MTNTNAPHSRLALLSVVLVLALVATACGGDDDQAEDGTDVAESVIASVDAVVGTSEAEPTTTIPEGCRIEQTEDEYGFPVDVVVCDGESPPSSQGPDVAFVDWAGGEEADRVAQLVRDALVIDGGCGEVDTIRELELAAASAPEEVRAPLEVVAAELARATQFCASDSTQWEAHLRLSIAALGDFVRIADAARTAAGQEATDG